MEVKKKLYLRHLAYESFDSKFSKNYFSTFFIIKGFLIALCLSIFIYLEYFSLHLKIIDTIFAFLGFHFLLTCEKKTLPWIGFFIGIFWFYWISFSFRYYDLSYLIPVIILGIGFIYGAIFYLISLLSLRTELRAIFIFLLTFLEPFGFNWFKPELILINSYFSTNLYLFFIFLLLFTLKINRYFKVFGFAFLLIISFLHVEDKTTLPSLDVEIAKINLPQDKKWKHIYKEEILENNFSIIKKAIKHKKDLIILPESAFPLYLNLDEDTLNKLKTLSYHISIVTGALSVENDRVLNSTYFFKDGRYEIAHKVILVPFGEAIPLPKFAKDYINKTFFNGGEDYQSAKEVHDFNIGGYKFRNAICFEATKDKLFENSPKYMIAMSNNAWFGPSIEPTLQNLLLQLYSKRYNTIIYHSANYGKNEIIYPYM